MFHRYLSACAVDLQLAAIDFSSRAARATACPAHVACHRIWQGCAQPRETSAPAVEPVGAAPPRPRPPKACVITGQSPCFSGIGLFLQPADHVCLVTRWVNLRCVRLRPPGRAACTRIAASVPARPPDVRSTAGLLPRQPLLAVLLPRQAQAGVSRRASRAPVQLTKVPHMGSCRQAFGLRTALDRQLVPYHSFCG